MRLEVQKRKPRSPGIYVAYVDPFIEKVLIKERIILYWDKESGWSYPSSDQKYRTKVYGWIGPLPPLKITKE